jgi:MarR family transcriptional regulator, organic hydroperoxide resistance regulator
MNDNETLKTMAPQEEMIRWDAEVSAMPRTQCGYLVSKIHQSSDRVCAKLLKEAGIEEINPAQGRILSALWMRENIPITELARETMLHKSTLTKMLDNLEASGHVKRVQSSNDRRVTFIRLTEKDRRLREKYGAVSEELEEIYYAGFTEVERSQLDELLNRVLDNLVGGAVDEEA